MIKFIIRIIILIVFYFASISIVKAVPINIQDSLALVALYNNTDGPNWTNHSNWLSGPVSTWYGVSVTPNRVWRLTLDSNNLSGPLPAAFCNLTELRYAYLYNNQISGSIPSNISSMTSLLYLYLDHNLLVGTIPLSIYNTPNLQALSLSENQISGTISPNIGNLTSLLYFDISYNSITDTIPSSIGSLINAIYISLRSNSLSGIIPSSIGNLTQLQSFDVSFNGLTGELPASIINLTNLRFLSGCQNYLTGEIPSLIGNLQNLQYFDWRFNQFSGPIPNSIGNLTSLTSLQLSGNLLTGEVPSSIINLPGNGIVMLESNGFTFAGMEPVVQHFTNLAYTPQRNIYLTKSGNKLIASVGGTPSNNTYTWYDNFGNVLATNIGDSTFAPLASGYYHVSVANSICTALTLTSAPTYFLKIDIIDPNPSLITSSGALNTDITQLNLSNTVEGAATDGVTKLIFYSTFNSTATFSIEGSNNGTLENLAGSITGVSSITISPVNGKVYVIYKVPDGFGNMINGFPEKYINIKASYASGTDSSFLSIKLISPPVVLVHGMWSNPAVWDDGGFTNILQTQTHLNIFKANYENSNFRTFDFYNPESNDGKSAVRSSISEARNYYKTTLKIACSQVDVVAHSLGGLITRSLSQEPTFHNPSNYDKGNIHKLITLSTPHRGSPFGPELWSHQNDLVLFLDPTTHLPVMTTLYAVLSSKQMRIGSCHRDFGLSSEGLASLTQTLPYKTFAVTADYTGINSGPTAMNALCFYAFRKTLYSVMASRCNGSPHLISDLIVPLNSQLGFAPNTGGKDTLFLGVGHSKPGSETVTNYPIIQNKVVSLLLSNDNTDFASGFPPPFSIPLDCNSATERVSVSDDFQNPQTQNLIDNRGIRITSPAPGTIYQDGSNASITLSFDTVGLAVPINSMFIIEKVGWFVVPNTFPFTVTINLPTTPLIGKLKVLALSLDSSGLKMADTSYINITPNGILDSLSVDPTFIQLDSLTRTRSLYIRGYFNIGINTRIADLTHASTGTVYSTNLTNIINVSQDGFVTALNPGTDTIRIINGNKQLKVPVSVATNFAQSHYANNIIDFPPIPSKVIGDDPFGLDASSSSGDQVNFAIASGASTIANGVLTMNAIGKTTVSASQAGNVYFNAASPVNQTFCVSPKKPTIQLLNGNLVSSSGTGNQWYFNNSLITGATDSYYTPVFSGSYTTQITINECTSQMSDSFAYMLDGPCSASATSTGTSCPSINNGTVTIQITSGTPPFSYSIDGGTSQSSNVFTGLTSGLHVITSTDANNCTRIFPVDLAQGSAITGTASPAASTCGLSNGSITATPLTGTAPYTYSIDGINYQSSNVFNNLAEGNYTVTIKDINGCTVTVSSSIAGQPAVAGTVASTQTSCQTSNDGVLIATATSGLSPFEFSIDGSAYQSSNSFTGLSAGTYIIYIKDANGCIISVIKTITDGNLVVNPTISITTSSNTICQGSALMFTSTATNQGNSPLYQWQKNNINVGGNNDSYTDNALVTGDEISLLLTSNIMCASTVPTVSNSITMTVNPIITPANTITGNSHIHRDSSAIISANISFGGVTPVISWQDSTYTHGWSNIPGASSNTIIYSPGRSGDKLRSILINNDSCATFNQVTSNTIIFSLYQEAGIVLYPNPAHSILTVDNIEVLDNYNLLQVFNMPGQLLISKKIEGMQSVDLNIEALPAGIYLISLKNNVGKSTCLKFVKL